MKCLSEKTNIFHFTGHGEKEHKDSKQGDSLVFEKEDGSTFELNEDMLKDLLNQYPET